MSNTDSFINEVSEEVRRDRLYALLRRWGWVGVLLVVLIVGGAAWNEWQKASRAAQAQEAGDALLDALTLELPEARAGALAAAAEAGQGGAAARLLEAGQLNVAGDVEGAVAVLNTLANDPAQPAIYRDLANLRAIALSEATMPPADRITALQPLAMPGATYAPLAREQIVFAQIEAGDLTAARTTLATILADAATPVGLRNRADALIVALGPETGPQAEQD